MSKTKCRNCGLVNAPQDTACRRCGDWIDGGGSSRMSKSNPREAAKKSSWLYTVLFIALLIAAADYLYKGVEKSYENVSAGETNRIASQPQNQPAPLSRTEADKQRAGQYKNAVQNAPALAESQKRLAEQQKLMQPEQAKQ